MIKKVHAFFILSISLGFQTLSFAQQNTISFEQVANMHSSSFDSEYRNYSIYTADINAFDSQLKANEFSSTTLEFGDDVKFELDLIPSYLLAEDVRIQAIESTGTKTAQVDLPKTYKAYLGEKESRITVNKGFINGFIRDGSETFVLESFRSQDSDETYVLFANTKDIIENNQYGCANKAEKIETNQIPTESKMLGDCFQARMAIAVDHSLFLEKGSIQNVIDTRIAIMNTVASNYEYNGSINFNDGVEFLISEILVSTCEMCDPWTTSTSSFDLVADFRLWSIMGGFDSDHTIGQFWSNRDFDGAYVGMADNAADLFCTIKAYHVLQDFTNNFDFLRVLATHEIGHNFGGIHESNTGFIMSSVLNNSSSWDATNQGIISNEILNSGTSCFGACGVNPCEIVNDLDVFNVIGSSFEVSWSGNAGESFELDVFDMDDGSLIYSTSTNSTSLSISPANYAICKGYKIEIVRKCGALQSEPTIVYFESPIGQGCADFITDRGISWISNTVMFEDESRNATSWLWDFGDGNTSTAQNPSHVYSSTGAYNVSLTVNSGIHSITKQEAVIVLPNQSLPYTLADGGNFESSGYDFAPEGLNETTNIWEKGIATGPLNSSDVVWKTRLASDVGRIDTESALYSPRFDFSITDTYTLEFDLSMEAMFCNGPFGLQMQYSSDNGVTWIRLGSYGDTGANTFGWYNRGPAAACAISDVIFLDQTGWTFNGNQFTSYDVSFLSGNSNVIFRFLFDIFPNYSDGYAADGAMINNFKIGSSGVVDLDLLSFSGREEKEFNQLDWAVENLIDFDYFVLEKSLNNQDFYRIFSEEGDVERKEYEYRDFQISNEHSYYRLKMVDMDESVEYSEIVSISRKDILKKRISVYPNPIHGNSIHITNHTSFKELDIFTLTGKRIRTLNSSSRLDVSFLPKGTYFLHFRTLDQSIVVEKLVVL